MFRSILNAQLNQDARHDLHRAVSDSQWVVCNLNRYKTFLTVHNACVNTIQWNSSGDFILSGSDDKKLAVTRWTDEQIVYQVKGLHKTNIMSAKFLPHSSDQKAVSCSGDGIIMVSDLEREDGKSQDMFNCHYGPVYDVVTIEAEPETFLSVGEDGTARWFDLRSKKRCQAPRCKEDVLFSCQSSLSSAAVNPILPHELAIGTYDGHVYIMDRRMLGIDSPIPPVSAIISSMRVPAVKEQTYRTTSVQFSPEGDQILASFSGEGVYLFDVKNSASSSLSVPKKEIEELFNNQYQGDSASRRKVKQKHNFRRVRLRGDWSDTGPTAGINNGTAADIGQARPTIHESFMQRMAEILRSMTNLSSNSNSNAPMSPVISNEPSFPASSPSTSGAAHVREEIDSVPYESLSRSDNQPDDLANQDNDQADEAPMFRVRQDSEQSSSGISISRDITECMEVSKGSEDNGDEEMEDASHCDHLYLQGVKMKYHGHRNARTAINEATFWGRCHIMSGSDCGHVFIWDRFSGKVVGVLQADAHVVNRVRPHPYEPILATSGIDHDIKLWAPSSALRQEVDVEELMARNARMLEETRDTITVPASYMIRMLATMTQFRQLPHGNRRNSDESTSNLS